MTSQEAEAFLERTAQLFSGASIGGFLKTAAVEIVQKSHRNRFQSEGDSASGMWAQLAPVTVERRLSYGFPGSHPINKRTGALERYVTESSGTVMVGATSGVLTYPGRKGLTPLMRKKVEVAQVGWDDPPTPPRPVIDLGADDAVSILGALTRWIEAGLGVGRV